MLRNDSRPNSKKSVLNLRLLFKSIRYEFLILEVNFGVWLRHIVVKG